MKKSSLYGKTFFIGISKDVSEWNITNKTYNM